MLGFCLQVFSTFFSVPASKPGADPTPVGLELLVHYFEPSLLAGIRNDVTYGLHELLDTRVSQYSDREYVEGEIKKNLPSGLDKARHVALEQDLEGVLKDGYSPIFEVMVFYLTLMGKRNLERVFPEPKIEEPKAVHS